MKVAPVVATRKAWRLLAATLLLGGVAPSLSCACGTSSQATPTADAALIDSGTPKKDGGFLDFDAPPYDGGPAFEAGPPGPVVIGPDGWADVVGFDECPMQFAATPAAMPLGITWVPCPASVNLPAGACRRIAIDFPDPSTTTALRASIEGNDVRLMLLRAHSRYFENLVVSASGPTLSAIRTRDRLDCGPEAGGVGKTQFAMSAMTGVSSTPVGVLLKGTFGGNVAVAKRYRVPTYVSVFGVTQGILEQRDGLHRLDWTTGADTTLAASGSDAFADISQFAEVGPRLYAHAGFPFHVYEYSSGTPKRILTAGRDATEVGSFAVDDTRIAWTSVVPDADHQSVSEEAVYVQDFSNGVLSGVRQRLPQPGRQGYSPSAAMNCGVLARTYVDPRTIGGPNAPATGGLEIFDFKSMKHWRIVTPVDTVDRPRHFAIAAVDAVTCGEVFIEVKHFEPFSSQAQKNFARFDLSKLGPGEAFTLTPDPVP